jgi:Domain of unknown function (DUF4926)
MVGEVGQHKAYVFQSALGIGIADAEELKEALLQAVKIYDAVYEPGIFEVEFSDLKGQTYALETLKDEHLMVLHHHPVAEEVLL